MHELGIFVDADGGAHPTCSDPIPSFLSQLGNLFECTDLVNLQIYCEAMILAERPSVFV